MKLNLAEYVLTSYLNSRNDKIALLLVDDVGIHREVMYSTLYHDVCCLKAGLHELGLPNGSIIGIQAEDVYDLLVSFLACNAAGLVPCPLLLNLSVEEIDYILEDSAAQLLLCLRATPYLSRTCKTITQNEYQTLLNHSFEDMSTMTEALEPAFLFYTSGSSGHPKGVLHAQHAILGRETSINNWLTLTADDVVMQTDNLCWTYSMFTGFLDPIMVGATALIMTPSNRAAMAEDEISAEKWLRIISHYKVSIIASTPNIYYGMVTAPGFQHFSPPALRQAGSAGAFLADEIQRLWNDRVHFPIYIALGMSEISTFISMGPKVPYREGKLGKIQQGRKVSVLPIEGGEDPVPANTQGMLAIHRDEPSLMLGYIGNTKQSLFRGEWFLTQDLVSVDLDGYIQYFGRADMIIKVDGGFRVSPVEIETALKLHPTVLDAACGVVFDKNTSANQLIAFIISLKRDDKNAEDIHQFLTQHLSDYKVPKTLCFVDHLPLNARGKLIRSQLRLGLGPTYSYG